MSRSMSGPAIVLRTAPLGEADLLVIVLTAELGKLHCAARNARRSRRRFPGGLPVGARGEASVARGRGSLWRLENFTTRLDHGAVGRDLNRLAYVAYVCELTDELILENEPDARLFARLWQALDRTITEPPAPVVLRRFELGLLDVLGLLPALDRCCVCGDELRSATPLAFDDERGGALCEEHAGSAVHVSAEVLAAAVSLAAHLDDDAVVEQLEAASAHTRKALRDLLATVLRHHLRRPLRSSAFFSQVAGSAGEPGA